MVASWCCTTSLLQIARYKPIIAVFDAVLSGMDIVKKIEALGSSSGKTSKTIKIADSGELPSRAES